MFDLVLTDATGFRSGSSRVRDRGHTSGKGAHEFCWRSRRYTASASFKLVFLALISAIPCSVFRLYRRFSVYNMVTDHLGDEEWDIGDILGVSNNLRLIASRHCGKTSSFARWATLM